VVWHSRNALQRPSGERCVAAPYVAGNHVEAGPLPIEGLDKIDESWLLGNGALAVFANLMRYYKIPIVEYFLELYQLQET
jgi:hypothetical protein